MAHATDLLRGNILTKNIVWSILASYSGNGIFSGLAVSERGAGANMSIDVASGSYRADGILVTNAATTNVVIAAADATYPRKDIITADSAGNITATQGTPAAAQPGGETRANTYQPIPPDIPANEILLAEVWVAAGATEIYDADIVELGVPVFGSDPSQLGLWGDANGIALSDDLSSAWYVYGELPAAGSALTAGKVVRSAWERLLVNKAQTNNVSIYGTENQLRVKANMAAGVHAGAFAYFEQSGAVTLSGAGYNAAINVAVETDASLTLDAGVFLAGAIISSLVNSGGTLNGSLYGLWIRTEVGWEEWGDYIRLTPDGDVDLNIITVGVTGTPIISWNESEDMFSLSKGIIVAGYGQIGTSASPITLATTEFPFQVYTTLTDGQSEGLSGYHEGHIAGTTAGHIYGLGSWINVDVGATLSAGHIIVPCEGGVYTSEAQATARIVFAGQHQAILFGAPASLHAWRLNTTQTIDALIAAANAGSVGYAASAGITSNKVGDIPIVDVVGHGVRYIRLYDGPG